MMQPDNQNLWAQLLGGLVTGGGQIITPNTDWVPNGALAWPLPQTLFHLLALRLSRIRLPGRSTTITALTSQLLTAPRSWRLQPAQ